MIHLKPSTSIRRGPSFPPVMLELGTRDDGSSLQGPACQVRPRRDALVASAEYRLIIHSGSAGTTSVPLRHPEESARRVRRSTLDNPLRFSGRDKHAPPICLSEGPACRGRCATLDRSSCWIVHPASTGMTSMPFRTGTTGMPLHPGRRIISKPGTYIFS